MGYRDWPIIRLFFSGFNVPGPLIAKFSRLWKLYHLLRGDYRTAVRRLHERHGPLVQIAPHEYSLSEKRLVYVPNLRQISSIVLPACQQTLERTVRMANLYSAESQIDSCNESLFAMIKTASDNGENIDITDLLTRYAHEVMLACTTGQRAGFLENDTSGRRIDVSVLENWKFYAILHGSYLRYHPFIASMIKRWRMFGSSSAQLMMELMPAKLTSALGSSVSSQTSEAMGSGAELEACIAMTMAAADPTIALVTTALHYISTTPHLIEELRSEIAAAQIPPRPTFKQLILARPSMAKLHAVLLECTRLHPPYVAGPEFRSSNGEIDEEQRIPPGSTITLEPTMIHTDPGRFGDDSNVFNPMRWLDASLAPELQRALLAFNLSDINNMEITQILVTAKLLVEFISSGGKKLPIYGVRKFFDSQPKLRRWKAIKCGPNQGHPTDAIPAVDAASSHVDSASRDGDGIEDGAPPAPLQPPAQASAASIAIDTASSQVDSASCSGDSIETGASSTADALPPQATAVGPAVDLASSNVDSASFNGDATASDARSTSSRASGSSKASFSSAGDRTVFTLRAANQLASILGEDDANELMTGRFAPSRKNFIGAKVLYTKPIPDNYLRRLVHKILEQTHGKRLAHFNNPDTNIMAIGLLPSIPRNYSNSKQRSGQGNTNNKRPQYNNNSNNSNNRGGRNSQSSNRGSNPPPRTTTSRPPPTDIKAGGFEAKWNTFAVAEGEKADYWKTAEGYAERQAKLAAEDAAMKATGADTQPRFKTTFTQTGTETVNGQLGGVRKAVKVEKY